MAGLWFHGVPNGHPFGSMGVPNTQPFHPVGCQIAGFLAPQGVK